MLGSSLLHIFIINLNKCINILAQRGRFRRLPMFLCVFKKANKETIGNKKSIQQ